jgi:UDP-N-acetylmuramyl pentapeptide synthase
LPEGVSFKLHYAKGFVPVRISGSLGKSQAYSAAAAAIVGLHLGLNLVQVTEGLTRYHGIPGRLRVLPGIKDTVIIDDTYNAAPAAMHLALDSFAAFPAQRRVAVLGDMLELGKYTFEAHQEIGNRVGDIAQVLVCVGEKAKIIADAAANQMEQKNIYTFHTSEEAKQKVQELLQAGDLVLVKGSQGKRMEKIVEEIMAEPERKRELLVRQSRSWLNKA